MKFLACKSFILYLVDLIGIEPMTSSMPWKRAPSCATGPHSKVGTTFLFSPFGPDSSNNGGKAGSGGRGG